MKNESLHVACSHCGSVNRVPRARLQDDPVCGRCGLALLPGEPVALGDANFDAVARSTELPLVVDFWAPWCGPCRSMAPQFAQAARSMKGRALFVKVNSDESPRLAARYGIRSIPTLLRIEGGREVARESGAMPASEVIRFLLG